MSTVAHTYNPSDSEGEDRRFDLRPGALDLPERHSEAPSLQERKNYLGVEVCTCVSYFLWRLRWEQH